MAEYGRYGIQAAPDEADPVRKAFNTTLGRYPSPAPGQSDPWRVMQQSESAEGKGLVDPVPGAVELAAKYASGVGPAWLKAIGALNEPRAETSFHGAPYAEGVVPGPIKALRRGQIGNTLGIEETGITRRPYGPLTKFAAEGVEQVPRRQFRQDVDEAISARSPLSAEQKIQQGRVNDRNLVYHATDIPAFEGIMQSGKINPSTYPGIAEDLGGVSVSRVPRVASKSDKPVTMAIDASRMPPTRPYAEPGYKKTRTDLNWPSKLSNEEADEYSKLLHEYNNWSPGKGKTYDELNDQLDAFRNAKEGVPNPKFEFENRTYQKPIPASAIRKILVDDKALFPFGSTNKTMYQMDKDAIEKAARSRELPVEYYPNGRALHSSPAAVPHGRRPSPSITGYVAPDTSMEASKAAWKEGKMSPAAAEWLKQNDPGWNDQ